MIILEENHGPIKSPTYTVLVDGKVVGSLYIYTGCKDTLFTALGKMQKALLKKEVEKLPIPLPTKEENANEHDNLSE